MQVNISQFNKLFSYYPGFYHRLCDRLSFPRFSLQIHKNVNFRGEEGAVFDSASCVYPKLMVPDFENEDCFYFCFRNSRVELLKIQMKCKCHLNVTSYMYIFDFNFILHCQTEGKKKKKEKEDENADIENRHEAEYKRFLDQQKLILEQLKIFAEVQKSAYQHAGLPGGFPPNSSSNQWQQPPASAPGYQNSPYQPNCYNPNLANQQGYQAPGWNEAPSHVSASSAPPPSSAPPSSRAPSTSSGIYPDLPSTFSANATSIK